MLLPRIVAITFLLTAPWAALNIYACQCREKEPPCAEYWAADAVFVGRVEEITPFGLGPGIPFERVFFKVNARYRGVADERVELYDWQTSCRFSFKENKTYLVYAYRNGEGILSTSYCSRTTELANVAGDMDYFRLVSAGQQKQQVVGALIDGGKRLIGTTVVATSDKKTYRTKSDRNGWFRLDVEPGKYVTKVFLPLTTSIVGPSDLIERISAVRETKRHYVVEYNLDVARNRCAYIDAPLFISNTRNTKRKRGE